MTPVKHFPSREARLPPASVCLALYPLALNGARAMRSALRMSMKVHWYVFPPVASAAYRHLPPLSANRKWTQGCTTLTWNVGSSQTRRQVRSTLRRASTLHTLRRRRAGTAVPRRSSWRKEKCDLHYCTRAEQQRHDPWTARQCSTLPGVGLACLLPSSLAPRATASCRTTGRRAGPPSSLPKTPLRRSNSRCRADMRPPQRFRLAR